MRDGPRLSDVIGVFFAEKKLPLVLIGILDDHTDPNNVSPWSIYERKEHPRGASFGFVSNRRNSICLYRTWFGHDSDTWISILDPDSLERLHVELQWMLTRPKQKRIGPNAGRE